MRALGISADLPRPLVTAETMIRVIPPPHSDKDMGERHGARVRRKRD